MRARLNDTVVVSADILLICQGREFSLSRRIDGEEPLIVLLKRGGMHSMLKVAAEGPRAGAERLAEPR